VKFRQDLEQSGGGRIRTDDLEVMSLASYLAAPPRVRSAILALAPPADKEPRRAAAWKSGRAVYLATSFHML
jgi:hypothetical protein